jgi:hypothetical protein
LAAIGPPMLPSPINPIFMASLPAPSFPSLLGGEGN